LLRCIIFFTILAIIIFVSFNDYEETISHLIKSLLFIPSENSKGIIAPIYGLGWTLNYEFYFYLIFAVGLLFKRNMSLIVYLIFPIEILEYNIFTTILVITISCILLGVITFNLIESNLTIVTKKLLNTIKYVKP
jgi:peptidoglycan/LPS O-acetylase OafA/YrhL